MKFVLTKQEKNAIRTLKNLAKRWPKNLWLFSANGNLCVMRYENGKRITTEFGGVDQNYIITEIDIPNDGGDW